MLFFQNIGSGSYHSLKTNLNSLTGEASKNVVTVSTASTHGLLLGDVVTFNSIPKNDETITVKYDNYNRRAVFNPKTFTASDVDTGKDTISITNHGFETGDKVIYTASSPSGGLVNEKIYYVLYFTRNKVRLCETKYNLNLAVPKYINITSASAGTLSPINPKLNLYKNKVIKFDVSDSSLSFTSGSNSYSAFKLNFYKDPKFEYLIESTATSKNFEVQRSGTTGVTTSTVTLSLNNFIPETLYYKLDVVNPDLVGSVKKEIVIDEDVSSIIKLIWFQVYILENIH